MPVLEMIAAVTGKIAARSVDSRRRYLDRIEPGARWGAEAPSSRLRQSCTWLRRLRSGRQGDVAGG